MYGSSSTSELNASQTTCHIRLVRRVQSNGLVACAIHIGLSGTLVHGLGR